MKKEVKSGKHYLSPDTRLVRVAVECSVCAASDVKKIESDTPNVEVDEWDEIGNEISFD